MDIQPPPTTENIEDLREWCFSLWRFLQSPHFEIIRIIPRSSAPSGDFAAEGAVYYDSDDDKLKVHNGTSFQNTY